MKQQKAFYDIGASRFVSTLNEYFKDGWTLTQVMRGEGASLIAIVEHEQPDDKPAKLPEGNCGCSTFTGSF